jgi:hypothetical protein
MRPTYGKKFRWKFRNSRFGLWDFENPKIPKKSQNPKSAFSPLPRRHLEKNVMKLTILALLKQFNIMSFSITMKA